MENGSYFKEIPAHRSRTEDREQRAGWLIKEPEAGANEWLLPTDLSMDSCSSRHPSQEWGDGHQSQAGAVGLHSQESSCWHRPPTSTDLQSLGIRCHKETKHSRGNQEGLLITR